MTSRSVWGVLLTIVLTALDAVAAPARDDVLLEVELTPLQVYVQEQVTYRMRVFHAVDVSDLKIAGPTARLAEVRPIGMVTVTEILRDGRRYRVHERRFAVIPFGSGTIELSGGHVVGRVPAVAATSIDGRQPIRLDAGPTTLSVQPVPSAYGSAPWLPARALSLSDTWAPSDVQIRTGQILRRQIRIEATGIVAAQIPAVELVVPGMLVRAETATLENRAVGDANLGVRSQTFSLVALQDGPIELPQLRLPWWNLSRNSLVYATLPARSLTVLPGDANIGRPQTSPPPTLPVNSVPIQEAPKAGGASIDWWWLTVISALFVLTLFVWTKRQPVKAAWALHRACQSGNASSVRDALLQWAAVHWPQSPHMALEALGQSMNDSKAQEALSKIDRCLYGPARGGCDSMTLIAAVRDIKRARSRVPLTQI